MAGELGFDTGPYIAAALFCESTIEDKNGVITIVRVVDQVTVACVGEGAPDDLPPGAGVQTTFVLMLKPGQAKGRQTVNVVIVHPDGTREKGPDVPVHFTQGPNNGANLVLNIGIRLSTAGLYWADVLVNDRLVTRAPLEVRYEPNPPV